MAIEVRKELTKDYRFYGTYNKMDCVCLNCSIRLGQHHRAGSNLKCPVDYPRKFTHSGLLAKIGYEYIEVYGQYNPYRVQDAKLPHVNPNQAFRRKKSQRRKA